MKKLFVIAAISLLVSACSAPAPKPCDSSYSAFGGSSSPCGPEIEINASYKF